MRPDLVAVPCEAPLIEEPIGWQVDLAVNADQRPVAQQGGTVAVPVVVGLTLCEQIDVDRQTNKVSLEGLFQTLHFPAFPSSPQGFTIYAILTDGVGEGTMNLSISRSDTGEVIYRYSKWFAVPTGRLLQLNLEIPVKRCVFPSPGLYLLTLDFDDTVVTERSLSVYSR